MGDAAEVEGGGASQRVTVIASTALFVATPFVSVATTYQAMIPPSAMLSPEGIVLMDVVQMEPLRVKSRLSKAPAPGFRKNSWMLFTPSTSVACAWNCATVEPRQATLSGFATIEVGDALRAVIVGPVLTQTLTARASVPFAGERVDFGVAFASRTTT